MSHGPEHQIEHAEHAAHASHHQFDKQVTISIAIIAAVLACVTMIGHRAHNDTLRLQGEALQAQLQSGIDHAQASNRWAEYQALNIRDHFYRSELEASEYAAVRTGADAKYNEARKRWESQVEKYKTRLPETEALAKKYNHDGDKQQETAKEKLEESHVTHERTNRFDLGELGLQLGVVLCSMAILTKARVFWLFGVITSLAGAGFALVAFLGISGH